jgi:hypothetical protein
MRPPSLQIQAPPGHLDIRRALLEFVSPWVMALGSLNYHRRRQPNHLSVVRRDLQQAPSSLQATLYSRPLHPGARVCDASATSRRRARRRHRLLCCDVYPVKGPLCNSVFFEGPICNVAA